MPLLGSLDSSIPILLIRPVCASGRLGMGVAGGIGWVGGAVIGTLGTRASSDVVGAVVAGIEVDNDDDASAGLAFCAALRRASCGARLLHCTQAWTAKSCAVWAADRVAALTSLSSANESARSTMVVMPMSART